MMVSHVNDVYVNLGFGASVLIVGTLTMFTIWYAFRDTRGVRHSLATASTRVAYVVSADTLKIAKMRKSGRHALKKVDPNKAVDPLADFGTSDYNWNYDWDERHYHYDTTSTYEQQLNFAAYEKELEGIPTEWVDAPEDKAWEEQPQVQHQHQSQPSTDIASTDDSIWWRTTAGSEWLKPVTIEDIMNARPRRDDGLPHVVDAPVSPAMANTQRYYTNAYAGQHDAYVGRHSALTSSGNDTQRALTSGTMELQMIDKHNLGLIVDTPRELVGASH